MAPSNKGLPNPHRWQFSLRQMFAAITGIAIVFGLAAWGGWVKSDAVVYLSIAVLIDVLLRATRSALLGACVILGAFWIAIILPQLVFGPGNPESVWIFFVLTMASSGLLRMYTRASVWSLLTSLVLIEILIGAVVVYEYGCPTLFQSFAAEKRAYVFQHFRDSFPSVAEHLLIAGPWLAGIVLGTIFARWRKSGNDREQPL